MNPEKRRALLFHSPLALYFMQSWKDIFTFTKQERNGLFVLGILVVGAIVFLFIQPSFAKGETQHVEIPAEFLATNETPYSDSSLNPHRENAKNEEPEIASLAGSHSVFQQNQMFVFNPNNLPEEDWVRLGLSPAQARSVKNFENKGGFFRTKEDVKKLYVISPEKYLELEPYIVIPERKDSTGFTQKKQPVTIYELNTVDSAQLTTVNGIGPYFASKILSYRRRLGGFHHKEQLQEVNGMDEEKYAQIQGAFKVDSTYISKMNVNTVEASELRKHPYFTAAVATALVNYRKAHGPFKQLSDIMKCHLVSAELYRKIAPYLTI